MTKKNVNFVKKKNNPHVWLRKTKSDGAWRYISKQERKSSCQIKGQRGPRYDTGESD